MTFRVVSPVLPTQVQPVKLTLLADGELAVECSGVLQSMMGSWESVQPTHLAFSFVVNYATMVADKLIPKSLTITDEVHLLANTFLYVSSSQGYSLILTPWERPLHGHHFDDTWTFHHLHDEAEAAPVVLENLENREPEE